MTIMTDNDFLREKLRPRRILFVEDDMYLRQVFAAFASRYNCEFTACGTAAEALDEAARSQFDILFLDIGLPDMSGYDLLRLIKMHQSRIKVVVVSGKVDGNMIDRITDISFALFAQKPKSFKVDIMSEMFETLRIDPIEEPTIVFDVDKQLA